MKMPSSTLMAGKLGKRIKRTHLIGGFMATLREQLDRIRENAKKRIPTDALAVMDQAGEALRQSGIAERILKPGETAPPFNLEDFDGKIVGSAEPLANGPLVVVFYRGRW
jgi:hypothetical protein